MKLSITCENNKVTFSVKGNFTLDDFVAAADTIKKELDNLPKLFTTLAELRTKQPEKIKTFIKKTKKGRSDRHQIIADLKHLDPITRKGVFDIAKKYDLRETRIYYWLKKAGMKIPASEKPKKKVEVKLQDPEPKNPESEEWDDEVDSDVW